MVTLTQNLYLLDEVKLAFLTALLKKEDLNECRYWLNEISLSLGEIEVRNYLARIYYDFYYATNASYATNAPLFAISLELLFPLYSSPLVFLLSQMKQENPKMIYINKKGSAVADWLVDIKDERLHPFMRAVNRSQHDGISYYANKLLTQNDMRGEELVQALCSYYKTAYIEKEDLVGIKDDLQYVLAVYAKFYYLRKGYKAKESVATIVKGSVAPAQGSVAPAPIYSIPLSIGAFKLQRWQLMQDKEEREEQLFQDDPLCIAFGLALSDTNSITEIIFAATNYIKAQLNEDDLDNFVDSPVAINDISSAIVIEQEEKQQLWLEEFNRKYSSKIVLKIMPTFASTWLKDVFQDIIIEKEMLARFNYKMFEKIY